MPNKIGKFTISNHLIQNMDSRENVMKLMGKMVVVRAEQLFHMDCIEYTALSEYFKEVKEGERIPKYKFIAECRTIDGPVEFKCEAI